MCSIAFRNVGLALNGHEILRGLDFELRAGEWTFLIAPPAAGRTLLLNLAGGALQPTSGAIERAGAAALILHDTPLDDGKFAQTIVAEAFGLQPDASARAKNLLESLGLDIYLGHEPFRLSRGHRKRLAIAAALAASPALLCLDDPFSPMDRIARAKTAGVLKQATRDDGLAILMASNDPRDTLRHADRIIVLTPGPAARIAANFAHTPTPDASDDELAALPLYEDIEAALWDETGG